MGNKGDREASGNCEVELFNVDDQERISLLFSPSCPTLRVLFPPISVLTFELGMEVACKRTRGTNVIRPFTNGPQFRQ